jgi:electron transfer flavoprotein beta subunit
VGDLRGVAVLVKVVATRVDVDARDGSVGFDGARLVASPADQAALAVGLELGRVHGDEVTCYCVGAPPVESVLRELVAAGAARAVRLALDGDGELGVGEWLGAYPSATVARALARVVAGARYVVAGDHSLDRGSGSVPARVAHHLGAPQALGLLSVDPVGARAQRRLAGGWRETIALAEGTVLSVEASAGRLGRGSPGALREARVEVIRVEEPLGPPEGTYAPYRPPADALRSPVEPTAARRAMEVIGALVPPRRREVLHLGPEEAADALLARLARWGYR